MKKTYINPNIEVVKMATRKMLADSGTPRSITTNLAEKDSNGDYNDARLFDLDFDED